MVRTVFYFYDLSKDNKERKKERKKLKAYAWN